MLKKKVLALCLFSAIVIGMTAQSIKGGSTSYFQAPSKGVEFASANVFISNDDALATVKKEAKQAKNSAMGSNFGAVGGLVADGANSAMDMMDKFNKMLEAYEDEDGRFSVWNFVPAYIIADAETDKKVNVEIFILNEPNPSPSASMPTTADKNGYYDIPYYVNCRYKVTDQGGNLIFEENLGILQGTQKTKNYTPQAAPTMGDMSSITSQAKEAASDLGEGNIEDEVPIQDRIGINVSFNAVRTSVYARYGFGQFDAPIKLGVVKESKVSKKMISPTLDVFQNKQGLLLNSDEMETVKAFAVEMEKVLPATTEKTKWVALHNLSVCYAWLEDAEKAADYYKQYGEAIKSTITKMDCWNAVLAGTMKSSEMKAKCGSTFIGTKDQKKYAEYYNINNFVNFYPSGAKRYEALMIAINRDLKKFVDFYAVNDLLCQLFEIDFPYQFFPLQDFNGAPKDMQASITKEGMEAIEYRVKFDSKRRIKQLAADQVTLLSDGSKEKLNTRDIMPVYSDDNGEFQGIKTDAGAWAREMGNYGYYSSLNYVYDPIAKKTKGIASNITKDAGFLGGKVSSEKVQLKVDLDGNIYFTGSSTYYKANAFFKEMLTAAGVVPKRVDTKTKFSTLANINDAGIMTNWLWEGDVHTNFGGALSAEGLGREQNLSANPMVRGIKFTEVDDKGNPIKAEFTFKLDGKMRLEEKAKGMAFVNKYLADLNGPLPTVSEDSFGFSTTGEWDCAFEYDDAGNWTSMKIGPYTATRTFKY